VTPVTQPSPAATLSCPSCAEPLDPNSRFCEACGTDLVIRRGTTSAAPPAGTRFCPGCDTAATPEDGEYCRDCGLRHPDHTDRVDTDLGDLAGVSDKGRVRARNEDAMALGRRLQVTRAAVVCDGVSTSLTPELAARAAADAALEVLLGVRDDATTRTREAMAAASRAVRRLSDRSNGPSCTLVCGLLQPAPEGGTEITVGWIGDSRAYWLGLPAAAEPAALLTTDHSWVAEMIAVGMDPATAAADRRAHAITRWLGPDSQASGEVLTLRPRGPGALLLCTDGLWNHVPDAAELTAIALSAARAGPPEAAPMSAAQALTTAALEAGGRDNITIVIIPVT
jgi:serine/threonine protein phosphatase PrpC